MSVVNALPLHPLSKEKRKKKNENNSKGLKMAATLLHYPTMQGILIERIDTHSLRSGGANALALSGYSDTQIQKMGSWKGATFKEYICEELACYSAGKHSSFDGSEVYLVACCGMTRFASMEPIQHANSKNFASGIMKI